METTKRSNKKIHQKARISLRRPKGSSECLPNGHYTPREEKRMEKADEEHNLERLKEVIRGKYTDKKLAQQPHSMVLHRGNIGKYLQRLEMDLRRIMEPNTASRLKVLKRNNLKDFIVNGTTLGVTHLLVITRSERAVTLRIIRSPQGPTLTFQVSSYTLANHVLSALKRPVHFQKQYLHAPLVIMSGFNNSDKKHLKLVQSIFQSMFPSIPIDTVKLAHVRRCFLVSYNENSETFDLRHYAIKAVPSGISKSAKKLLQSKVPDLSKYKDISEYFLKPGQLSDSEYEGDQKEIELPQDLGARGCKQGHTTSIRLIELGPRLTLSLMKVVEGVDDGEVLYHSYITKTVKELMELRKTLSEKRKIKERRVKDNEHRVIRRLTNIAQKKKAVHEVKEREKNRLIEKQNAVTAEYYNEVKDAKEKNVSAKRKTEKNEEEIIWNKPKNKRKRFRF